MSGTRWLMSSLAYYSLESLNCAQKQMMSLNDWIETASDDKQRLPLFTEHHAKSGLDFIFTAVICDIYFDLGLMLIF